MFEAGTVDSWEPCGICAGSEGRMHCVARSDPQGANVATGVRLHYAHQTLALTGPQGVQVVVEGLLSTAGRPSPYHPGSVEIEGVTYVYFATQGAYISNTNSSSVSVWCAASANNPSFSEAVQSTTGGRGCGPSGALYPASAVSYFQRTEHDLIFRAIADVGCDWEFGGVNFSPPSPGGDYIEQISVGQPWGNSIAFAELDYPGTPVGSGTLYRHRPVRAIITLVEVNTPNGIGTIEDIIVTSLGHIQVRVKFNDGDDTTYMKYIVSSFNDLIKNSELTIVKLETVEYE
jgi:hypothetical protein